MIDFIVLVKLLLKVWHNSLIGWPWEN